MAARTYDVFLSHNSQDKAEIEEIALRLQDDASITSWLDAWAIRGGVSWEREIETALSSCKSCAVFLGKHGWGQYHLKEARYALQRHAQLAEFPVIPVLLPGARAQDQSELGDFFEATQCINFAGGLYADEPFERLAASIRSETPYPEGPPQISPYTIRRDARRWVRSRRKDKSLLYQGTALREAQWIAQTNPEELSGLPAQFLQASAGEVRRRRVIFVASAALALIIMMVLGIFGFLQQREAEYRRQVELAQQLAVRAEAVQAQSPALTPLSVLLSIESLRRAPNIAAQTTLYKAASLLPPMPLELNDSDSFGAAQYSHAGQYIVATKGKLARVWDVRTGHVVSEVKHDSTIDSATFSPDDRWLLTRSNDETARVWDVVAGVELARTEHDGPVNGAALSPDGQVLASAGEDGTVNVVEVRTGGRLVQLRHDGHVRSVSFNSDGRRLVTGSDDRTARVWEIETGQEIRRVTMEGQVDWAIFKPNSNQVLVSDGSGDLSHLELWDIDSGQKVFGVETIAHSAAPAIFTRDGKWIVSHEVIPASAVYNYATRILDASNGQVMATLPQAGNEPYLSPDEQRIVTVDHSKSEAGTVQVWELQSGKELLASTQPNRINTTAFSANAQWIVTSSNDGVVRVWDAAHGTEINRIATDAKIGQAAFNPDSDQLLTADSDKIRVWHAPSGLSEAEIQHGDLKEVGFSPDGRWILTRGGNFVKTIDVATGKVVGSFEHDARTVVQMAAFSPDSKRVFTAAYGDARLWDIGTRRQAGRVAIAAKDLSGAFAYVSGAVFSPDSQQVLVPLNNAIGIMDTHLWRPVSQLGNPTEYRPFISAAFSPNGKWIATEEGQQVRLTVSTSITLWDAATGQPIARRQHIQPGSAELPTILTFAPDGNSILIVGIDENTLHFVPGKYAGVAQIWNPTTDKIQARFPHEAIINSAAFSPDGRRVLTASRDKSARIWDSTTGENLRTLLHDDEVRAASFSRDGRWVVTASDDKTVRVWDAQTGGEVARLPHDDRVLSAAFSADGKHVVTGTTSGLVRIFAWEPDELIKQACARLSRNLTAVEWEEHLRGEPYRKTCPGLTAPDFHTNAVPIATTMAVGRIPPLNLDTRLSASANLQRNEQAWLVGAFSQREALTGLQDYILALSFSPDGKTLAASDAKGGLQLWDVATGKVRRTLTGHRDFIGSLAFSPDGQLLYGGCRDRQIRAWDVATGQVARHFKTYASSASQMVLSPNGTLLVSANDEGAVTLWDTASGKILLELAPVGDRETPAAFSRDGKTLAIQSDHIVTFWDLQVIKPLRTIQMLDGLRAAAIAPDSRILAAASSNPPVRLYDIESGKEVRRLADNKAFVRDLAFSPGGAILGASNHDGTVDLWEATTGRNLGNLKGHPGPIAFSPDGRFLAFVGENGLIQIWEATLGAALPEGARPSTR